MDGTIVSLTPIRFERTRMVISRRCCAVTGDKSNTLHGEKGVITVVPDHLMLQIGGVPVDLVMGEYYSG